MYKRQHINCSNCNIEKILAYRSIDKAIKKHGKYICQSCIMKQPKFSEKNSARTKIRFTDPKVRENLSKKLKQHFVDNPEAKNLVSKHNKLNWQNEEYRTTQKKASKLNWQNEEYKEKVINSLKDSWTPKRRKQQSQITKTLWKKVDYIIKREIGIKDSITPERRKQLSEISKKLWENPKYREKQAIATSKIGNQSILDTTVISILKNLGYNAKPAALGPWTFDALVELDNDKDLLIECQGDYWHSRKERIIRDTQKRTYYDRYLSDKYDLLILWEHEFYSIGRIADILRITTGTVEESNVDFAIKDLKIKLVETPTAIKFLQKYHYMMKSRAGVHYGAYLENELIAVCSFSSITRKSSATRLKLESNELIELSRLCVNPSFRKQNLASKLISKSIKHIKKLYPNFKSVITFADTTLGHTGTVYKAANFKYDGDVKPTYWYIDPNGYHRHKKTVWDQAKRLKMKENDYAKQCKLVKINGKKLLRFIYKL